MTVTNAISDKLKTLLWENQNPLSALKKSNTYLMDIEINKAWWIGHCLKNVAILGPLLFLIYVNDLHKASSILKPVMFAEDTNLFLSNKNINKLFNDTSVELQFGFGQISCL